MRRMGDLEGDLDYDFVDFFFFCGLEVGGWTGRMISGRCDARGVRGYDGRGDLLEDEVFVVSFV